MLKRAVCVVINHKYQRVRYPESPDGYFLRCLRCGHERDEPGVGPSMAAAGGAGSGG